MNPHTTANRNLLRQWLPGLIVGALAGIVIGYSLRAVIGWVAG